MSTTLPTTTYQAMGAAHAVISGFRQVKAASLCPKLSPGRTSLSPLRSAPPRFHHLCLVFTSSVAGIVLASLSQLGEFQVSVVGGKGQ